MTQSDLINRLKEEATKNPVANAVFHVFALRQRARHNLTINGLKQKMKLEGFSYSTEQYGEILKLLDSLGIGKVDRDPKGRIRALKGVQTSLQSIGAAAVGTDDKLKNFRPKPKFMKLVPKPEILKQAEAQKTEIRLTVLLNDKPIQILIPKNLTAEEIAGLITGLQDRHLA